MDNFSRFRAKKAARRSSSARGGRQTQAQAAEARRDARPASLPPVAAPVAVRKRPLAADPSASSSSLPGPSRSSAAADFSMTPFVGVHGLQSSQPAASRSSLALTIDLRLALSPTPPSPTRLFATRGLRRRRPLGVHAPHPPRCSSGSPLPPAPFCFPFTGIPGLSSPSSLPISSAESGVAPYLAVAAALASSSPSFSPNMSHPQVGISFPVPLGDRRDWVLTPLFMNADAAALENLVPDSLGECLSLLRDHAGMSAFEGKQVGSACYGVIVLQPKMFVSTRRTSARRHPPPTCWPPRPPRRSAPRLQCRL